ncbi:type IVB secretion system protein IcmH/DotU [Azospirillum picis]|uniref:Type VI secretion system protein ImpK n=1 Tax=Azospirillum picis TaxID=488438 RepID=A0ABU0MG56_9PROT|nr:type IVB secretion system protein IcmH/DotU [Azospirillum picis]MBP2298735.1 type VI secretion system protein ImpK [Azospirillum picis]MDQ0532216.1 type VI secretion system protein ImpK [Azospirillum picis]
MTVRPPPDKNPFEEPDDIDATVMQPMAFQRPAAPAPGAPVPPPPSGSAGPVPPAFGQGGVAQGSFAPSAFAPSAFPAAFTPAAPSPARAAASMGAASPAMPVSPAYRPLDDATLAALASVSENPLVTAAAPILALVGRVRDLTQHRDVDSLRERVIGEMQRFEAACLRAGLPATAIRNAGYALCATIDDVVLATSWGSQSLWAHKSMVSTIQKETWGGERFFDLLDQMAEAPDRHLMELELFYLCVSLGFEGRYRVTPRGYGELARLRDRIYRIIRRQRGEAERDLSPRWRGVADGFRPLAASVPLWLPAAVILALLAALYLWFVFALGDQSDAAHRRLAALLPDQPVQIARIEAPATLPAPRLSRTVAERVAAALAPDIKAGLVDVDGGNDGQVRVRTRLNVFAPGSDRVEPRYVEVFRHVAEALRPEAGRITVIGNTDATAIRSQRFGSNQELSEARAGTVQRLLTEVLGDNAANRLAAEGRGDTDPIAPNTTAEGRQANRRVDIVLAP